MDGTRQRRRRTHHSQVHDELRVELGPRAARVMDLPSGSNVKPDRQIEAGMPNQYSVIRRRRNAWHQMSYAHAPVEEWLGAGGLEPDVVVEMQVVAVAMPRVDLLVVAMNRHGA